MSSETQTKMSGKKIPKTLIVLMSIIAGLVCIIVAPILWQQSTEATQSLILWFGFLVVTLLGPAFATRAIARRRARKRCEALAAFNMLFATTRAIVVEGRNVNLTAKMRRAGRLGLLYGFLGGIVLDLVLFLLVIWSLRDGLNHMIM